MEYVDARFFGEVFVTLAVIIDPLGTIPIFLALTGGRPARRRRRLAGQAVVVSLLVITSFALFGQQLLAYLGISVPALQASGGLLLSIVALELLTDRQEMPVDRAETNVALVPLGTPLLAGPGAIVATIVFVRAATGLADYLALAAGVLAIHLVLYLALRFSVLIIRLIRESGVLLLTRISGLLLAAIAVQLVADAVRAFVTGGG